MVVDTSVLLAIYFAEQHAEWATAQLDQARAELCMSTVNLTETLIRIRDRQPKLADEIESRLFESGIRFVPPDLHHSRLAAAARRRYPLNLGDCFAYALAKKEEMPILTLDSGFRSVDCEILLPG